MNRVKFHQIRMQAWLCAFYLTPFQVQRSESEWSGCAPESLLDESVIRVCSRIAPGLLQDRSGVLPDRSGHAPSCSGYDPGCSGSQKRREVGPKTEREGLEDSAENNYISNMYSSISNSLYKFQNVVWFCSRVCPSSTPWPINPRW